MQSIRIDDFDRDSRQRMADATTFGAHLAKSSRAKIGGVDRDCRRTFRTAVAFVRPDTKVIFKCLRDAFRQFFRARHHEAQAAKIFGRAAACVGVQESGGGEQHGHGIFADQRANHARIERVGMKDHADAGCRGEAKRAGKAKRMEKRENAQDAVAGVQHENLVELLDVGSDVVMRQDNTFGIAGRAAGKNNCGNVVERGAPLAAREVRQRPHWQKTSGEDRGEFLARARLFSDVFDENHFAWRLDLQFFKKNPRGHDGFQIALRRAGSQRLIRNGVIQIYRDFAHQHRGKIHQRARHRGRQQHPNHFLPLPVFAQTPRQNQSAYERRETIQLGPLSIGHGEPQRMPSRRIGKRFRKRVHALLASFERFRTEILHHAAHFLRSRRGWQRLPKRDANGIRNPPRELPEKAPARKTENRAPDAVEIYGDNGHVYAFDDALHAAAERHHLTNARHLPLRKNAHDFAVFQRFRGLAQGMNQFARPLVRGDGNRAQNFRKGFYQRMLIGAAEHQKADGPVDRCNQERGIGHGNMIRSQQRAASRGHVFAPHDV